MPVLGVRDHRKSLVCYMIKSQHHKYLLKNLLTSVYVKMQLTLFWVFGAETEAPRCYIYDWNDSINPCCRNDLHATQTKIIQTCCKLLISLQACWRLSTGMLQVVEITCEEPVYSVKIQPFYGLTSLIEEPVAIASPFKPKC